MRVLAALLSFILTSCNMFNNEAPYKYFFSDKEYPIIEAIHNQDKDKLLEMMRHGWNVNSMGEHGMSYHFARHCRVLPLVNGVESEILLYLCLVLRT